MACRHHDASGGTEVVHAKRHHWRRSLFSEEPYGDSLRNESVGSQCGKSCRVVPRIVSNDNTTGGDLGTLVPNKLGQSLRGLYDSQRVHAREPRCHAATKTGGSEFDAYMYTHIRHGPTKTQGIDRRLRKRFSSSSVSSESRSCSISARVVGSYIRVSGIRPPDGMHLPGPTEAMFESKMR